MTTQWTEVRLAELPVDGFFRLRGQNMSRLDTFVDAAFAFAVTLLVISVDNIPNSYDEFIEALLKTPTFIACFFQLIMFWLGHRAFSRRYGLESLPVLWASLTLVAGILVIVYPLQLMYAAGLNYASQGFLPSTIDFSVEQMRTIFVLYGSGFGILSLLIALLFWFAASARDQLMLSEQEYYWTKADLQAWLILSATGFISVIIALITEGLWLLMAGWLYMILVVVMPLQAWYTERQIAQIDP